MNRLALILLSVLAVAGCSHVANRIQERQAVFSSLDPSTQEKLKKGEVDVGYTPDMVYIALGNPDEKHEKLLPTGVRQTWIYHSYYQEYQGTAVSYYRHAIYYPPTRSYIVVVEPVSTPVYADRASERLRVEFVNGKVSAIEQMKDQP